MGVSIPLDAADVRAQAVDVERGVQGAAIGLPAGLRPGEFLEPGDWTVLACKGIVNAREFRLITGKTAEKLPPGNGLGSLRDSTTG